MKKGEIVTSQVILAILALIIIAVLMIIAFRSKGDAGEVITGVSDILS